MRSSTAILLLLVLVVGAYAGYDGAAWQSKTIYQFLTDRFNSPTNTPCPNLSNYCGGTWAAATEQLDYILGMGFDAIWISPVVENTPGGYHGYWTQDFQAVNPYFGNEQDLKNFVQACHNKGLWVMVDIVANHVGPVDTTYTSIVPFNVSQDYHQECQVNNYVCFTDETLLCRLADLPDLNQTVPYVRQYLFDWIKNLMETFDFDGIRADTVMYIEQDFWVNFTQYAGAYIVGEVYTSVDCCIAYQEQGVPGVLSYPMFFTLRSVFQQGQNMNQIQDQLQAYAQFPNQNLLGNFIDNQDQARFLNGTSNVAAYWNAITFVLLSQGIPIIYYGTEQNFHGGNDPDNREILWPSKFATSTNTYQFISQVVNFRKSQQVWNYPYVQRYSTSNFYAFTRGNTFVALTNTMNTVTYTITYQPYSDGTQLCNIFAPSSSPDCLTVQNGQFAVTLGKGLPKIYIPSSN